MGKNHASQILARFLRGVKAYACGIGISVLAGLGERVGGSTAGAGGAGVGADVALADPEPVGGVLTVFDP